MARDLCRCGKVRIEPRTTALPRLTISWYQPPEPRPRHCADAASVWRPGRATRDLMAPVQCWLRCAPSLDSRHNGLRIAGILDVIT
ncbi:MAG: hypothetical protein JWL70_1525 [Acidimicrobiia bacterium]|nr:hypothetical protein [Acidimicrobiia bacterium]